MERRESGTARETVRTQRDGAAGERDAPERNAAAERLFADVLGHPFEHDFLKGRAVRKARRGDPGGIEDGHGGESGPGEHLFGEFRVVVKLSSFQRSAAAEDAGSRIAERRKIDVGKRRAVLERALAHGIGVRERRFAEREQLAAVKCACADDFHF